MTEIIYQSPLQWPNDRPQTHMHERRNDHGFSQTLTLDEALSFLEEEIKIVQAHYATMTSDVAHIRSERMRRKVTTNPAVTLRVVLRERHFLIACDRWVRIEHNIYAVHLALRHFHNMEKWGLGEMTRLMAGLAISTGDRPAAAPASMTHWMEVLGLGPTATLEDATAIYHRRARQLTDDQQALSHLNQIMEEARRDLQQRKTSH